METGLYCHAVEFCCVFVRCSSDDDSMDVESSHVAANMACVLNFVKKMLAIVSLPLQLHFLFPLFLLHALHFYFTRLCTVYVSFTLI